MILTLIKRDPAWQFVLTLTVLIGAGVPLAGSFFLRVGSSSGVVMFLLFIVGMTAHAASAHVHATRFEAALPIDGRDLFVSRTIALLAMIWLPLLLAAAVTLLLGRDGSLPMMLMEAGAILTPVVALQQAIRVGQLTGPPVLARSAWVMPLVAGFATYYVSPAVLFGICGATSAAILIFVWPDVPQSFQVASLKLGRASAVPTASATTPHAGMSVWWPVVRSAFTGKSTMYAGLMVLQGMFGGGFYFLGIFALQGMATSRRSMQWLTALPLSPAARLRFTLLSTVVPLLVGLGVGMCIPFGHPNPMETGPQSQAAPVTAVPLEFWRYAPDANIPAIRTPWGETIQPTFFQALGLTFYNPYTILLSNGQQVHDWQLARATQAVFGTSMSPAQYFEARRADNLKPRTGTPLMRLLTFEAVAFYALLMAFVAELVAWHRLQRLSKEGRVAVLAAMLGIPVLLVVGLDPYFTFTCHVSLLQAVLHYTLLQFISAVPNRVMAVTLFALPVGAMYWVLTRQFARSELTGRTRTRED